MFRMACATAVAAPAPAPSTTVKASATTVRLGDVVTFTGEVDGIG